MDRRRLKSGSGLHRRLHSTTGSQSSLNDEEPLSDSSRASSVRSSQRVSNSEMLRRKTTSVSTGSSSKEMKIPQTTKGNQLLKTPQKLRLSAANALNPDKVEHIQSPVKPITTEISSSTPNKRKRPNAMEIETKELASFTKDPLDDRPLSKRKRFVIAMSDSESDQENVPVSESIRKLGRSDPHIVSQKSEKSTVLDKRPTQVERRSQISLKRPSQRESNTKVLMKLTSPMKAVTADENLSPGKENLFAESSNKLEDFFKRCGITLSKDNEPHQIDDIPAIIVKRVTEVFSSGIFNQNEIVDLWKAYANDEENLKKGLNDMSVISHKQTQGTSTNFSLVRMILQIPQMQTVAADHLLQKLNEAILTADSMEEVPWASLLLQQFRFLEVIMDTDLLNTRLEELLESCPTWFQRELILFIPDLVIDVQHHAIAEMLSKLMATNVELTNAILECITNLTLGKEYLEELREKILNMLKNNTVMGQVPVMARFVLYQCPTIAICEKTLTVLRSLELHPLLGEKPEEYFTNQTLLVSEMKMSMLLSKDMSKAARNVIKKTVEPSKPLDLVILLLLYSGKSMKKNSDTVLRQHVKTGYYRTSLLASLYQDYKEVAKDLQPEALQLASNLLKSEDRTLVEFAIEWFKYQFISQADTIYKQREIIEKIILLMGNNDQTAKGALEILRRMTENDGEMKYLHTHCNHLRILLEKIDNFDLQEVATLSDILYALCRETDSTSQALQDDLFILLQKQLSNAKTLTKCKGVLNAAMAIKNLAGESETCELAKDLIAKVQTGVKDCPRSRALFYDQIGSVIADTKNIDSSFLRQTTEQFQDEFVNNYMNDLNDHRSGLVPKYCLNAVDNDPQKYAINFGDGKCGAVVPAFFRLLRICYMRLHDGSLEEINGLLGCPVFMPKDMDVPEPWTLDLLICCINWFRELVSGFVSQNDPDLQEQVLKRLNNLMNLQAEFSEMLKSADARYQPPPCYFHIFPPPAFVKIEKKVTKKGKRGGLDKTIGIPEWEAWEIGSTLCSKNPTYFRRLDPKVVDLLDLKLNQGNTQTTTGITKAQVCFLVKELLGMLEGGEASEVLLRDLVNLLPKICIKLKDIIEELRAEDDTKNRHIATLILSLLTRIFDWKSFRTAKYHSLLRDGLRTLAGQIDKQNTMLRSSKELVAESYKYFESLVDVSTDISFAFAVVKMCRSLMKHSETFTQHCKSKQANMASGFLALAWPDDKATGATYKTAVVGFLSNWMQNEPNPLETVSTVLQWLPDEVSKLDKIQDRLERLPSITEALFHHMFQKLFEGMISGVKIALNDAKTDPERINVWQQVGVNVQKIVQICKSSSRSVLLPFLKSMTSLLRIFLSSGIPVLEQNLRFQTDDVTRIMKLIQGGTRYLNMVCVDGTEKKDMALAKVVPPAKQLHEKLLFHVKGMLVYNNSSDAFWMGNLVNKNLEGQQIFSQTSSEEPITATSADNSVNVDTDDEARSSILQSDVEEQMSDEDA